MNKKTILKFNSTKSVRPFAWLALAILAVGAFGNSVQAEVWLNETFEQYTVASPATAPNTDLSPLLMSPVAHSTVISGKMAKYAKAANVNTGSLMYALSTGLNADGTGGTTRPQGYISFKILQNASSVGTIAAGNYLSFRLGAKDINTLASAAAAFLDLRFLQTTTGNFRPQIGGANNTTITISPTAVNNVKIWYNGTGVDWTYPEPTTGAATTLNRNTYVVYVNNVLGVTSANGVSLPTSVTTLAAVTGPPAVAAVTSQNIGKIAFLATSSQGADFSVDDIYAADSAPVASGPTIDSSATASVQAGYPFSYTITSSGVASPVYTTSPLPSYLSLSGGVISGTIPTTANVATTDITLTASGTGGPATKTLALTITAPPTAVPSIGSTATTSGKVTVPFSYQIMASGSGGPITSYTATPLPAGLSLNPTTGVISGTPTATGTTDVICTAINPIGPSSTQTLTITIDVAPTATWNGTGTLWNSATSWNPQAVPSSLDTAIFADLGSTRSVNVGTGQTVAGILFNSVANAAYSLTGTEITVASAGGITNSVAAIQTFANKVINAGGTATWSCVSGGSLVFNGGIDISSSSTSRALIFGVAGNVTVGSVIANGAATSGTVTVNGTGTTTFSGNNTYDGLTTMNAPGGTLTLSGNNSGATGGVTLTAGTLNINNANALGFGVLNLAGTGATINNTSGTAVVNAGDQPWTWENGLSFGATGNTAANNLNLGTGVVTASSSRTITLAGTGTKLTVGRVNITSSASGRTLTADGAGNTLEMGGLTLSASGTPVTVKLAGSANIGVTGPIVNGTTFAHGVEVLATGTTTFSGVNTYTGPTIVSAGTLILSGANSSSGYKIMGNADTVSPILKINAVNALNTSANLTGSNSSGKTGTLEFGASGNYTLNQFTGDTIRFSNSSGSATTLTFTGAQNVLSTGGGRIFANQSANLTITFNGQVDIGGSADDTCSISAIGPVVISGPVVNSSSFVRNFEKSEVGTLTMSGVNSYNGTTTVSRGTLNIPMGGSLAACGPVVVASSSTAAANSANLNLAGAANVVQVGQNGFVRGYTSGSTTTLGTITSLQMQNGGTVEVALDRPWTTGGTINFATGSKVSVTGTPVSGQTYTLMTATADITGTPTLAPAASTAGWGLRVTGNSLYLEEVGIITIDSGPSVTYSTDNIITGSNPMTKRGSGTLILNAPNDYTGGTILEAGTLQIENSSALGTGAVMFKGGTLKSTVDLDLGKLVESTTSLSAGFQAVYGGTGGRLQYTTGQPTTINGPVTLDVGDGTMTMGTLIGNSSSSSLVTKIGAGTVKLMGGSTKLVDMAPNGNASSVLGGWRIQSGTVWFTPSANNGAGNGPITLAGGTAKFSKLQNSNGTYTGFDVPSDLTVESNGLIQFDPDPVTLLGQNNLGFGNLSIGNNTLTVATATTSSPSMVGQGLPSVNFASATLTGSATLNNPVDLDLNLQAVSGAGGFTKTGLGTLYLSDQPNQAAAFATLTSGGVGSVIVEYAGDGYAVPPAAAPAVTLVAVNGGSGAEATATIDSNGRVSFITVTAAGSGYNSSPRVVIAAPPTVATANSYAGATTVEQGKLNLSGNYASSVIVKSGAALQLDWLAPAEAKCSIDGISAISTTITATTASYAYVKDLYLTKSVGGYQPGTFEFDLPAPAKVDGTGTATGTASYVLAAARARASVDSNGFISALEILDGGSGYAITPKVTIPAPTVPTVVARTTGSITFESGAKLSVNNPPIGTGASCTLLTADGGILGAELPGLLNLPGYTLTKSGNSLILTDNRAGPTFSDNPTAGAISYGQSLAPSNLNSSGLTSVPGSFAWKNAGTLLPVGTSSQIVTFTPNDLTAYRPAEFTVSVTVSKASLTPVFSGNTSPTYDGTAKSLSATTTPATIVNLTYDESDVAPTSAGIYTVVATVSDANYQGTATTSLVIGRAAQTITFGSLPAVTNGTAPLNLAATASSGLEVSYASSDTSVATVSGSTVTILKAGSTIITASQAGGDNYNAAPEVTQTLTVNPAGTIYNDWLTANGGIASDAAFLDYVFGAATPGALPASLKPTVAVTSGNLVLTYYVRTGTLGLTVTAQTSADLATGAAGWGTSGVTDVPVGEPTTAVNGVRVQQRTASVSASSGKKFLRIQAVQAAP